MNEYMCRLVSAKLRTPFDICGVVRTEIFVCTPILGKVQQANNPARLINCDGLSVVSASGGRSPNDAKEYVFIRSR